MNHNSADTFFLMASEGNFFQCRVMYDYGIDPDSSTSREWLLSSEAVDFVRNLGIDLPDNRLIPQ